MTTMGALMYAEQLGSWVGGDRYGRPCEVAVCPGTRMMFVDRLTGLQIGVAWIVS